MCVDSVETGKLRYGLATIAWTTNGNIYNLSVNIQVGAIQSSGRAD